jgi:CheY-like chemotaxis protein
MDGDLSVTSEMGVGSTFAVKLPLQVSQKNPDRILLPNSSNEAADFSGATVLVVDDSQINVLFLVSMLKQLSCKVESASNGQEALTLIKQNHYDFALIDINMPILNGIDLVKILREQKVKLKLVAVSAYADEAKINEALSAGFDIYITKPIEEYQLIELIQASKV